MKPRGRQGWGGPLALEVTDLELNEAVGALRAHPSDGQNYPWCFQAPPVFFTSPSSNALHLDSNYYQRF